jgi:hypothetical protein
MPARAESPWIAMVFVDATMQIDAGDHRGLPLHYDTHCITMPCIVGDHEEIAPTRGWCGR